MALTPEQALRALSRYPACIYPALEALPEADAVTAETFVRRLAAAVGDQTALRNALGFDPADIADIFPALKPEAEPSPKESDDPLADFIDRFSPPGSNPAAADEPLIVPAPVNYAAILEAEETALTPDSEPSADDATASAIDSFLDAVAPDMTQGSKPPLSASLAKVMIKNGNYQKAIEIITELHLKNPKKSVYFADQIRFLEKLKQLKSAKEQ